MSYKNKLENLIPGGAHTYSRGSDQFPINAPEILSRGKGAYVWDEKKNKYLDYGMALRANTLGYSNKKINRAAINQINLGNNFTRPSEIELKAAECFVKNIPSADMVKFAKNGSNVTTAAIKLARSSTGRNYIAIPRQHPFYSFDDWFISTTPIKRGTSPDSSKYVLLFDYGNLDSLINLFDQFPNQIAGVMLEPATSEIPIKVNSIELDDIKQDDNILHSDLNFLFSVQNLCKDKGSLFILDEMITGFRWHLKGAAYYFGVEPDLITFGKAMANGFSISALGGKKEIMELGSINIPNLERTFLLSSTHGAEMCSLGAFVQTVEFYKRKNVCSHLWKYGIELKNSFNNLSQNHNLRDYLYMIGPGICLNYICKDNNLLISSEFRTLFSQEMIKRRILMPWISISYSHGKREMNKTLNALDDVMQIYKKALSEGVHKYLEGPSIKPVFRKYN